MMQLYYEFIEIHGIDDMCTLMRHAWRAEGYSDETFYEIRFFFSDSHTLFHSTCWPNKRGLLNMHKKDYPTAIRLPEKRKTTSIGKRRAK